MLLPIDLKIVTQNLYHFPFLSRVIDQMGISDAISAALPVRGGWNVTDVECAKFIILNIAKDRPALYRMSDSCSDCDMEAIFGRDLKVEYFNDDRLGRFEDHIHDYGTDRLMADVARIFLLTQNLEGPFNVHMDPTTLKVFGKYDSFQESDDPSIPVPKRGFSKDHRPDLKQLVYGFSLLGRGAIPVCATMHDGNTSDKEVNAFHIEQIAALIPPKNELTFFGDSKLVEKNTLGLLLDEEFFFVSRLPRTYSLHRELVERLRTTSVPSMAIGFSPRNPKQGEVAKPVFGASVDESFVVSTPRDGDRSETFRFLVIRAPGLEKTACARFEAKVSKEHEELEKKIARITKSQFNCASDAEETSSKTFAKLRFHSVKFEVEPFEHSQKSPKRKSTTSASKTSKKYRVNCLEVVLDEEAVEKAVFHAKHFILITNHMDRDTWPDSKIYTGYGDQYKVEGHTGFRWLKGPARVAPILMKTPKRINAMGLLFVLALMVRNYVQWIVRMELRRLDKKIPYYGGHPPTQKPTAEVVWHVFRNVRSQTLISDENQRRTVLSSNPAVRLILSFFGLFEEDLLGPRGESPKWLESG